MLRILFILSLLFIFSCDDPVSSSDPLISKLYVCDQGSDRVIVLDATTDNLSELAAIDINFSESEDDMEIPHFIAIDEAHGYWFVTTFQAGYVGMYDLNQDTLISSIYLGDSPALLAVDEDNQMLYVSKMMTMGAMQGGDDELGALDYSDGYLVETESISLVDEEDILSFPEPHAISFASGTSRGLSLITASFTADWFSMIRLDNATITPSAYPFNEGEEAVIEVNELFPLDVTQKDNFIFFSCRGSMDADVNGQVQSWALNNFQQKSIYEYNTSSKPWHIISSPTESEIFVVLSGDSETSSSAGLSCLTYNEDGELSEKWTITDSAFDTLHGLTISSDGTKIYVSSRGDGSIHIFDALTGNLLNSVEGVGMMMDMDIDMGSLSGIAIIQ
jgi:DNA-binding beta-propeller fold protein YncE